MSELSEHEANKSNECREKNCRRCMDFDCPCGCHLTTNSEITDAELDAMAQRSLEKYLPIVKRLVAPPSCNCRDCRTYGVLLNEFQR